MSLDWRPGLASVISKRLARFAALTAQPDHSAQSVQGVPDVSAMARVLADRCADACNVDRADYWKEYGQDCIEDVHAMLATPSAGSQKEQGE
jgi:hypothetical protein